MIEAHGISKRYGTTLAVDDGDQAQHVVVAARHDHPPPQTSPAFPREAGERSPALALLRSVSGP